MHRGAFCHFPFRCIYYCHGSKSTGKETGKMHLCGLFWRFVGQFVKEFLAICNFWEVRSFFNSVSFRIGVLKYLWYVICYIVCKICLVKSHFFHTCTNSKMFNSRFICLFVHTYLSTYISDNYVVSLSKVAVKVNLYMYFFFNHVTLNYINVSSDVCWQMYLSI